jgi:hypothetical protein
MDTVERKVDSMLEFEAPSKEVAEEFVKYLPERHNLTTGIEWVMKLYIKEMRLAKLRQERQAALEEDLRKTNAQITEELSLED